MAVTLNNSRQTSNSPNTLYKTLYGPTWSALYTQPLLKGFKIDNNRQQLIITKLNQDISEIQLQALIINTVSNVRNAYWDYVFAVQSVDVAQAIGGPRRPARERQPDARRSRHDGADRHRAGAVAGRDAAAESGDGR